MLLRGEAETYNEIKFVTTFLDLFDTLCSSQ